MNMRQIIMLYDYIDTGIEGSRVQIFTNMINFDGDGTWVCGERSQCHEHQIFADSSGSTAIVQYDLGCSGPGNMNNPNAVFDPTTLPYIKGCEPDIVLQGPWNSFDFVDQDCQEDENDCIRPY